MDLAPEGRRYTVRNTANDLIVDVFRTAATPDHSADEIAVGHAVEHSAHHDGTFTLYYDPEIFDASHAVALCRAHGGVGTLLVNLDDLAADAMHAGPTIVCSTCGERRTSCTAWECPSDVAGAVA